jgi:hypothetical protein
MKNVLKWTAILATYCVGGIFAPILGVSIFKGILISFLGCISLIIINVIISYVTFAINARKEKI